MRLSGRQIAELAIVNKIQEEGVQQVGVDLNLISVSRIIGGGFIPKTGKTHLGERVEVRSSMIDYGTEGNPNPKEVWVLQPGVYDITLAQGCKLGPKHSMRLVQRSSVFRNGGVLSSSMFDPGFETENIGTILHINLPITIEVGARVCQAYVDECYEVREEDMYDGQFQNDSQRQK